MNTGILASYREKFILLQEKILSDEQFVLYEFCIHQADFDVRHKDKFGTFQLTNRELGIRLGWSEDKVGRQIKVLLKYGLLIKRDYKTHEVVDFFRYLPKNAFQRVKNKEELAYLQQVIAFIRVESAKIRPENVNLRNNKPILASTLTSISDNFSSKYIPFTKRTYEDYQKIKEKGGYNVLTEDDMKWIDENIN
jgi:DNA-binding Lrp family transcriptional regulator